MRRSGSDEIPSPSEVQDEVPRHQLGAYERSLVKRGEVTLWISPEAIVAWTPTPSGKPGELPKFSDLAIETALALRLVFHLPLRQTDGSLQSLLGMMGLDLEAPDHTTLSRRSQRLNVALAPVHPGKGIHLIVDSTGLSIAGEGEWAAAKHGARGKRGWRTLHLGVDRAGTIIAQELTESGGDDASTGVDFIRSVSNQIKSVTGDSAYDPISIYREAAKRRARVVVPPIKTSTVGNGRSKSPSRNRTIRRVERVGRRQWKKESGYHYQGRVENAFFRYKAIIGSQLHSSSGQAQRVEAVLACNNLNRMTELGRPKSFAIDR